jgi:hypothetical protein
MPDELVAILRAAWESSEVAVGPDEYVIPKRRPASVRRSERYPKVIWEPVRRSQAAPKSACTLTPCVRPSRFASTKPIRISSSR